MTYGKIFVSIIWSILIPTAFAEDEVMPQTSCGLVGIPTDTSETNLYTLPPIGDDTASGIDIWSGTIFGDASETKFLPGTDYQYSGARLENSRTRYRIYTNDRTQDFVAENKRREMMRFIRLGCEDQTSNYYYFKIPIQDMNPPRFEETEYTFNVHKGWNPARPISEGQFVIVSDNAIELGDPDNDFDLTFEASVDGVIDIHPVKLWSEPNQKRYYYRLDILLIKEDLSPGQQVIILTAKDQFNGGTTKININVSAEAHSNERES